MFSIKNNINFYRMDKVIVFYKNENQYYLIKKKY